MSPALNRSLAIARFKGSNAIEIRDRITFDFYTGLPHVHVQVLKVHDTTRFRGCVYGNAVKIPFVSLFSFYSQQYLPSEFHVGEHWLTMHHYGSLIVLDKCKLYVIEA